MNEDDARELTQALQGVVAGAGKLLAVYAEIEGMKALNKEREMRDESLGYPESCFAVAGNTAEEIAKEIQQIVA